MSSHVTNRQPAMISTLILFTLMMVSPAFSEPIDGFRDIKFGMTEKEVSSLEACASSSECLYELLGKNRYLHPSYQNSTSDAQDPPRLYRITIDMGKFSDSFYGELQNMLLDNYTLTHDLTENDINAFMNEQTSELVLEYEGGAVQLKVVRRQFGNLILKVIYQNEKMAAASNTQPSSSQ